MPLQVSALTVHMSGLDAWGVDVDAGLEAKNPSEDLYKDLSLCAQVLHPSMRDTLVKIGVAFQKEFSSRYGDDIKFLHDPKETLSSVKAGIETISAATIRVLAKRIRDLEEALESGWEAEENNDPDLLFQCCLEALGSTGVTAMVRHHLSNTISDASGAEAAGRAIDNFASRVAAVCSRVLGKESAAAF